MGVTEDFFFASYIPSIVLSDMTVSVLCLIFQWSSSFSMLRRFFSFTSRSTVHDSRRFSSDSFLKLHILKVIWLG